MPGCKIFSSLRMNRVKETCNMILDRKTKEILRRFENGEELTPEEIQIVEEVGLRLDREAEEELEEAEDEGSDYYDDDPYGWPQESQYAGTYVHDVVGWSDEMIDDVLEGDPDAYWNID